MLTFLALSMTIAAATAEIMAGSMPPDGAFRPTGVFLAGCLFDLVAGAVLELWLL
jgi:hypothetical protein